MIVTLYRQLADKLPGHFFCWGSQRSPARRPFGLSRSRFGVGACLLLGWVLLGLGLTGCQLPQVKAEDRLFLAVGLEVLGEYRLPQQDFQGTTVGGLSAIAYSPKTNQLYALSDDRGRFGSPRFYTLSLQMGADAAQKPTLQDIEVVAVTELKTPAGQPYEPGILDPEGMALSPRDTVLLSSEGDPNQGVPPFLGEFDLATGQQVAEFRLPDRYLSQGVIPPVQGVQNNLSLESLTLNVGPASTPWVEPFRLFTATESALIQDYNDDPSQPLYSRFLHYLIGEDQSTLIAEHLYPLDLEPQGALLNGLSELLTLDQGGHFLALERAFGLRGFQAKLYQLATGGATDISTFPSVPADGAGIIPIRKRLALDFNSPASSSFSAPDNLEGMTLGPRLSDGRQSLLLVSDNNLDAQQDTQFLLLGLTLS